MFAHQQYEKARDFYLEALSVEATCTEALFNLGLTYKQLGQLQSALECFHKLHMIFRSFPEVIYQLADMYPHRASPTKHLRKCVC